MAYCSKIYMVYSDLCPTNIRKMTCIILNASYSVTPCCLVTPFSPQSDAIKLTTFSRCKVYFQRNSKSVG